MRYEPFPLIVIHHIFIIYLLSFDFMLNVFSSIVHFYLPEESRYYPRKRVRNAGIQIETEAIFSRHFTLFNRLLRICDSPKRALVDLAIGFSSSLSSRAFSHYVPLPAVRPKPAESCRCAFAAAHNTIARDYLNGVTTFPEHHVIRPLIQR